MRNTAYTTRISNALEDRPAWLEAMEHIKAQRFCVCFQGNGFFMCSHPTTECVFKSKEVTEPFMQWVFGQKKRTELVAEIYDNER